MLINLKKLIYYNYKTFFFIFVTKEVSNNDKSKVFNEIQFENNESILIIVVVLKLDKSIDNNDSIPSNIELTF